MPSVFLCLGFLLLAALGKHAQLMPALPQEHLEAFGAGWSNLKFRISKKEMLETQFQKLGKNPLFEESFH